MTKQKLLQNLIQIESCSGYFVRYQAVVEHAQLAFSEGDLDTCTSLLDELPTEDDLYETLVMKLKGKRVYQTLRKIDEGEELPHWTKFKALTSFLTHLIVECERGNTEYELLLPRILDVINVLAYPESKVTRV